MDIIEMQARKKADEEKISTFIKDIIKDFQKDTNMNVDGISIGLRRRFIASQNLPVVMEVDASIDVRL